jgi:tyrosyl-tRNA synthetase
VTALVHGAEQVVRAERASSMLFADDISAFAVEDVMAVFEDVPSSVVAASEFTGDGVSLVDLIARVQLAPSKGEARRLVQSGGVYVNNRRTTDVQQRLRVADAIEGRLVVLRKGSKQNHLVRLQ